jgi:hypothetical protein
MPRIMEEYIFVNVVHLCHNKHHIWSLEVQDYIDTCVMIVNFGDNN